MITYAAAATGPLRVEVGKNKTAQVVHGDFAFDKQRPACKQHRRPFATKGRSLSKKGEHSRQVNMSECSRNIPDTDAREASL